MSIAEAMHVRIDHIRTSLLLSPVNQFTINVGETRVLWPNLMVVEI